MTEAFSRSPADVIDRLRNIYKTSGIELVLDQVDDLMMRTENAVAREREACAVVMESFDFVRAVHADVQADPDDANSATAYMNRRYGEAASFAIRSRSTENG